MVLAAACHCPMDESTTACLCQRGTKPIDSDPDRRRPQRRRCMRACEPASRPASCTLWACLLATAVRILGITVHLGRALPILVQPTARLLAWRRGERLEGDTRATRSFQFQSALAAFQVRCQGADRVRNEPSTRNLIARCGTAPGCRLADNNQGTSYPVQLSQTGAPAPSVCCTHSNPLRHAMTARTVPFDHPAITSAITRHVRDHISNICLAPGHCPNDPCSSSLGDARGNGACTAICMHARAPGTAQARLGTDGPTSHGPSSSTTSRVMCLTGSQSPHPV